MGDEFVNLTWKNHGPTYQQMLNSLRIQNVLTDCTLACEDKKFNVHKLVLVTCSDFFKNVLVDISGQYPVIYLRGVNGKDMESLIQFMYLGEIEVARTEIKELLSTAESLCIKGLSILNSKVKMEESSHTKTSNSDFYVNSYGSYSTSSPLGKENVHESSFQVPFTLSSHKRLSTNETTITAKEPLDEYVTNTLDANNASQSNVGYIEGDMFPSLSKSSYLIDTTSYSQPESDLGVIGTTTRTSECVKIYKDELGLTPLFPVQLSSSTDYRSNNTFDEQAYLSSSKSAVKKEVFERKDGIAPNTEIPTSKTSLPSFSSALIRAPNLWFLPTSTSSSNQATTHNTDAEFGLKSNANLPAFDPSENVENMVIPNRPHSCPICKKAFAKISILKRHHLAHYRPYNCHICPRSFTRREVLAEHVLEHNGADLRLPCPVCNVTIKRKRNLQAHIRVKHPEYLSKKGN